MFSLGETLAKRQVPARYNPSMGVAIFCGRRPASITRAETTPCPQSCVVHFKSLVPLTDDVRRFIKEQFGAMQRLFAEGAVAVLRGTTEDLSGDTTLQALTNLDVGPCRRGQSTQDQVDLFANRNGVAGNELVVYIVATLIGGAGNFLGCAAHPAGQPGAAVVQDVARWLVAHEIGHVLGLSHVCEVSAPGDPMPAVPCGAAHSDSLMFPNVGWTNVPPDLTGDENATMENSDLTVSC